MHAVDVTRHFAKDVKIVSAARTEARSHRAEETLLGIAPCCYCYTGIKVYDSKDKLKTLRALPFRERPPTLSVSIEGRKKAKKIFELPSRPCGVCIRDIHHHSMYGKYPDGSPLTELSLFDPRLK